MKGMRFFWGVILLILGVLFLGTNIGWWPNAVWISFLSYWPIIVIVLGLRVLIKNNGLFSILALIIIIASLILSLYLPGVVFNRWHWSDNSLKSSTDSTSQRFDHKSISIVNLKLEAGAGRINIEALPVKSQDLFTENNTNMGPIDKNVSIKDNEESIKLFKQNMSYFLFNPEKWGNRHLTTKINQTIKLNLTINSGASSYDFDLSKLKLNNLVIDTGASTGSLKIGNLVNNINATIDMGASNLVINLPAKTALKLTRNSGLTKITFKDSSNITESNKLYISKDYQNAENKINLSLVSGASNLKINFY